MNVFNTSKRNLSILIIHSTCAITGDLQYKVSGSVGIHVSVYACLSTILQFGMCAPACHSYIHDS